MSAKGRGWDGTVGWPVPRISFVSPRPLRVHKEGRKARAVLRLELTGEMVNSRLVGKSALCQGGSIDKWECQARLLGVSAGS